VQKDAQRKEKMKLMAQTVRDFEQDHLADKAVFEAAMIKRIETEGYKMSDMLYELYLCQRAISQLKYEIEEIKNCKNSKSCKK
jgi:hypothetical protein